MSFICLRFELRSQVCNEGADQGGIGHTRKYNAPPRAYSPINHCKFFISVHKCISPADLRSALYIRSRLPFPHTVNSGPLICSPTALFIGIKIQSDEVHFKHQNSLTVRQNGMTRIWIFSKTMRCLIC